MAAEVQKVINNAEQQGKYAVVRESGSFRQLEVACRPEELPATIASVVHAVAGLTSVHDSARRSALIDKHYRRNCTFEDDWVLVQNSDNIRAAFTVFHLLLRGAQTQVMSVRLRTGEYSASMAEVEIDTDQKWQFPRAWLLPRVFYGDDVTMYVTDTIKVNNRGQVVYHSSHLHNYLSLPFLLRLLLGLTTPLLTTFLRF